MLLCTSDGAIGVLLLIVSILAFPVGIIVCCLMKKIELDEKGGTCVHTHINVL